MSQTSVPKISVRNKNPGKVSTGANTEILINGNLISGITFLKIEIKAGKTARVMMEMVADVDMELDSIPDLKTSNQSQYQLGPYNPRQNKGNKHD